VWLARISAAVEGVVPTAVASWPIDVSELPADGDGCSVLGEVRDWAGGSRLCLYYFDCITPEADLAAVEHAFTHAKTRAKKARAYPRLNSLSSCLYVGSSQSLAKRLGDHLGYGASGTYALQLQYWARPLSLRVELVCAKYADATPYSVVQTLEDALWESKAPMFGRQGRT
jgi:hypothetical protein